jgi:tetratricopeptide (TPR) repeat protein
VETESIGSNEAGTSVVKDNVDKSEVDKEEEDDPSNLQLSWEMLELAKTIFSKHADGISDPSSDKRLELEAKLSETYQLLGEVSIENENYEQAVEDLTTCLRRRQELLPGDSRCIAETHYQLGVALGFNLQFDKAVEALEASIGVLEERIKNLKAKTESKDPTKKDDAFYTREKEIEEITGLIPEIKEKIVDTWDMQRETLKKIREQNGGSTEESEFKSSSAEEKPVSNITNLVKKRKKTPEEELAEAANGSGDVSSAKKPHLETNGDSKTNGTKTKTDEEVKA